MDFDTWLKSTGLVDPNDFLEYTVKYSRYFEKKEERFEKLEEALAFAFCTHEYELGYVIGLIDKNSKNIMDHDMFIDFCCEIEEYAREKNKREDALTIREYLDSAQVTYDSKKK